MVNPSDRRTPPETPDEWAYLWDGTRKAHEGWPVTGALVAVFRNWKAIGFGIGIGLLAGGERLLAALGVIVP